MLQGGDGPESSEPQYYRITCPNGHALRGLRTEGFQALRCPSCGEGVFILPVSPLPEPPAPAERVPKRTRPERSEAGNAGWDEGPIPLENAPIATAAAAEEDLDEIEWEDATADPAPGPPQAFPEDAPPRPSARPRPAPPRQREEIGPAPPPRPLVPVAPKASLRDWAYDHRHRLVFAGVLALFLLTVATVWRRRLLEDAPRAIELAQEKGIELLEAGKFDEANLLLSKGARAVDAIGGAHQGAAAVRQAAAEAALFVNLGRSSLESLVDEAGRFDPPASWPAEFKRLYAGQAVILEGRVSNQDRPSDTSPRLDLRVMTGDGPRPVRTGRIDISKLTLFSGTPPKPGDRVLFGGRLEALTLGSDGDWVFRFEPESAVAITHTRALTAIGWPDPAADGAAGRDDLGVPGGRRDEGSLRGFTDQEVQGLLGRPESVARWATQGQTIEQWSYRGLKGSQVINFKRRPGEPRMTVSAHFSAQQ